MKNANKFPIAPDSCVFFATFSLWSNGRRMPTNGSVEPLRDFLLPRVKKLVLLDQLVPGEEDITYKIEEYRNGNKKFIAHNMGWWYGILSPFLRLTNSNATQIPFKIRDFLSVIDWAFRDSTRFDYFIGLESINAIAGILLRFFGRVRTVVYYVSDYSPNRYANKLFNAIYLSLDRIAATHADYIWDVSKAMQPARIAAGLDPAKSAPVIHVPNGVYPDQITKSSKQKRHPFGLVYMGTVGAENGPDVAIRAVRLLKKRYPKATLDIIGGKPKDTVWLRNLINSLGLTKSVTLHGFVPDAGDMATIMGRCSIGVAPYRAFPGSARWYGDAGKIRSYCAAGLAVVSSQVPPLGREVAEFGAAIIARDNAESFADAITRIFANKRVSEKLRIRASLYASTNIWENQFTQAFNRMNT